MENKIFIKFMIFTIIVILVATAFIPVISIATPSFKSQTISQIKVDIQSDNYILYTPEYFGITYLINLNGDVVHNWQSSFLQGLTVYLFEDGNLMRNCLPGVNPTFMAGGITGRQEVFDWYGDLIWEFEYFTDQHCLHHDYEVLPNGNMLMIAWELKNKTEAIDAGRNPNNITFGQVWPDHVIEVEPTGPSSGDIVWEWHVWDHLIQDYDSEKDNYGAVADHPELIDINFGNSDFDLNHINSIDYNEEFDQILLSSFVFNEIWVIDHSTTTVEAAGHTGGNSGKGGDLLYRWGNPQAYRAGTIDDQKLYGQHDAQWIKTGCPGEGNILVFNNGLRRPNGKYSSVDEIVPPVDENGNYTLTPGEAYGPDEQIWIYTADNLLEFYSPRISGAERLANGNTLICEGNKGKFFEVTPQKDIIWEYLNPYPNPVFNDVFKICRYSSDYPGLEILINAPKKPSVPDGPIRGGINIEYFYSSITTDAQGDQIYYWFDWGDGSNSDWIGPFDSGEEANASHKWNEKGNYEIKVKAKDINDYESIWSNSLIMTMNRNKPSIKIMFPEFYKRLNNIFQILQLLY